MNSMEILRNAYSRSILVPVVGAGISLPFSLPDWAQLLRGAGKHFSLAKGRKEKLEKYLNRKEYLAAADILIRSGVSERMLQEYVAQTLAEAKKGKDLTVDNNYTDFSRMPTVRFVTTNYDRYLNDFTGGNSITLDALGKLDVNTFGLPQYDLSIIPIHGEINRPESIVLSPGSYKKLYRDFDFYNEFRRIREGFVFLFIGFSFDDVYVRKLFRKMVPKRLFTTHYILFDEKTIAEQPDKIRELEKKYGIKSIAYDAAGSGHAQGIRDVLEQIMDFRDEDVKLAGFTRLPDRELTRIKDVLLQKILEQGIEARHKEQMSEARECFDKLFAPDVFATLPVDVKVEVIASLIWCQGTMYDLSSVDFYLDRAKKDPELAGMMYKFSILRAQMLWNVGRLAEAIEILEEARDKSTYTKEIDLFIDICKLSKDRWTDEEMKLGRKSIYGETDWTREEKRYWADRYRLFRDAYINAETCNLKNLQEYRNAEEQEFAYYWLGVTAGQIFHEHEDAIQFLLRAGELTRYSDRRYTEQLAHNYLELARNSIRYRSNSKAYELDHRNLEKALTAFRYVFLTKDETLLKSLYKSCGHDYLTCMYLMRKDYDFERFWERAVDDIEPDIHLYRLKAEVDARFMYRTEAEVMDHLSSVDRMYFGIARDISLAAFYGNSGLQEQSMALYRGILHQLDAQTEGGTVLEEFCRQGDYRVLDAALDSAHFLQDKTAYAKYRKLSEQYRGEDPLLEAFALEEQEDYAKAEDEFRSYYELHPDSSTFNLLNSFYDRRFRQQRERLQLGVAASYGEMMSWRDKTIALFEEVLSGKGAPLYDRLQFLETYILVQLNQFNDRQNAVRLYLRFYDEFEGFPEIKFELEEIFKSFLFDYADSEERLQWNRMMLDTSPRVIHQQYYRNMLNLYMANFRFTEAQELWKEIKENLEMQHPETTPEYRFLQIVRGAEKGAPDSPAADRCFTVEDMPFQARKMAQIREYQAPRFAIDQRDAGKMEILLPMRVVLLMFWQRRQEELNAFAGVYVSMAASWQIQLDLCRKENQLFRDVLGWLGDEKSNAHLFVPDFADVMEDFASRPWVSPERTQIECFIKARPEIKLLFGEMIM